MGGCQARHRDPGGEQERSQDQFVQRADRFRPLPCSPQMPHSNWFFAQRPFSTARAIRAPTPSLSTAKGLSGTMDVVQKRTRHCRGDLEAGRVRLLVQKRDLWIVILVRGQGRPGILMTAAPNWSVVTPCWSITFLVSVSKALFWILVDVAGQGDHNFRVDVHPFLDCRRPRRWRVPTSGSTPGSGFPGVRPEFEHRVAFQQAFHAPQHAAFSSI